MTVLFIRESMKRIPFRKIHIKQLVCPQSVNNFFQVRHCFNSKFSSEERVEILNILNKISRAEDLTQYKISKKGISEILKYKAEKGSIDALEELAPALSVNVLNKFFTSVIHRDMVHRDPRTSVMYPVLTPSQIEEISNVLSFTISGSFVSLCNIHRTDKDNLDIKSLEIIQYPFKPKIHFLSLLNEMKTIALKSPECDLLIVEEFPSNAPSPYMFNFQMQMGQARSMFLGYKLAMPQPPVIISMKTVAVARLFKTYIGFERVSGQHLVESLIADSSTLKFPYSVKNEYLNGDSETKERLSHVLLLNLSYWKFSQQFCEEQNKSSMSS